MISSAFQLSVSVRNVTDALSFYKSLGFRMVSNGNDPFPWAHVTDEQILISLAQDGSGITALTYFNRGVKEQGDRLSAAGLQVQIRNDGFTHALLRDPNGVAVWLIESDAANVYRPTGTPASRCGRLGELSIEADDLEQTISFWTHLGLTVRYRHATAPWVTMEDDLLRLGIYQRGLCPHRFRNPAVTYFEPDMADRIAQLKADGVVFVEDILSSDAIVREAITEAPDGPMFFLFGE